MLVGVDAPLVLVLLVVGVVVLTPVATRTKVPQPVLLTLFGLVVGFLPNTTEIAVSPELVLPVVLPPLLFAATQRTTVREFRDHAGPVLVLAVGLTLATVVVASLAHLPGRAVAGGLGAGCGGLAPRPGRRHRGGRPSSSPPPAGHGPRGRGHVQRRHGPGRLQGGRRRRRHRLLLGRSASAGSSCSPWSWASWSAPRPASRPRWVLSRIHDGYVETTVTVAVPFAAYVGAEHLRGSGVLAVLVLGPVAAHLQPRRDRRPRAGCWAASCWSYADFLITSLVFALLGYELIKVVERLELDAETVRLPAVTIAVVIGFRFAWVFPTVFLARLRARRRDVPLPGDWREATVVSWAGMRGVVTVATALALPEVVDGGADFPMRDTLVVVAFGTVLVTLVAQGLTLAPLTQRLGVSSDHDEQQEAFELRQEAARAALAYVETCDDVEDLHDEVREAARVQYAGLLTAQDAMQEARRIDRLEDDDRTPADELLDLLTRATDVERQLVLEHRRHGRVSAISADEVLREIEGRALRDLA